MEWLLEIALIGLLLATMFHAVRLERALGVLKRDRAALEELVAGFNDSTRAAEQGIDIEDVIDELKAEREEALRPFGVNTAFYQLADMPEPDWAALLNSTVAAHRAKEEAAQKAEAERIAKEQAEAAERERIRQENERLRQEALNSTRKTMENLAK